MLPVHIVYSFLQLKDENQFSISYLISTCPQELSYF